MRENFLDSFRRTRYTDLVAYQEPDLAISILDFRRPKESNILLDSLNRNLRVPAKIYYLSNSPEDYVYQYIKDGKIDVLLINKENVGCGIATRQLFHAVLSKYNLYLQVDQWLYRTFTQDDFQQIVSKLNEGYFYADLAGNQGNGQFSERAFLIETQKYLDIPDIDSIIGSPGPYANYKWGEHHIQEYMKNNNLQFTSGPLFFADNGKMSRRTFPCGAETLHFTDEKRLFILKPFKRRYDDFPNLKLNNFEWKMALEGNWPEEGLVPEADKTHSFVYWR